MSSVMIFQLAGEMPDCRLFQSPLRFVGLDSDTLEPEPQGGWATHALAREDSPARSAVP